MMDTTAADCCLMPNAPFVSHSLTQDVARKCTGESASLLVCVCVSLPLCQGVYVSMRMLIVCECN